MNRLWYIIFGLTVVIVLLLLFQPADDSQKVKDLEAKVKSREDAIFQLHRESLKAAEKRKADSLRFTISIQAEQRTSNKLTREIARIKASPIIIKVRDSVPEVNTAFEVYDSLISSQQVQIELQSKYIDSLRVDFRNLESNFQERIDLQSDNIADLTAISSDQRKQLRKTRRAVRLLKVVAVVGAVGGLLLGSSL